MVLAQPNAWLPVDHGTPRNAHILVWNAALALLGMWLGLSTSSTLPVSPITAAMLHTAASCLPNLSRHTLQQLNIHIVDMHLVADGLAAAQPLLKCHELQVP